MQTLEYHTRDKASWGPGPWQTEPDKRQWQDKKTGLPCLIVRGPSGALCGYVGVPPNHILYKQGCSEVDVDVHGGLTFADTCSSAGEEHAICHKVEPGEFDDVWWFGFDCAHSGDLSPAYARNSFVGEYRDIKYVTREVERLAAYLFELCHPGKDKTGRP